MPAKDRKSYVRVKVILALAVYFAAVVYWASTYILSGFKIEQLSLTHLATLTMAIVAIIYAHNIKCEKCKTKWFAKGRYLSPYPPSILDVVRVFSAERSYKVTKTCRTCEFERY